MCEVVIKIHCGKEHHMQSKEYQIGVVINPAASAIVLSLNGVLLDPANLNSLPVETQGEAITEQDFVASGGTGPYSFAVDGALPAGLDGLSDGVDTFRLSGTPTASGTFSFGLTATDSLGASVSAKVFKKIS